MKLKFMGAAGTVTGSKYFVTEGNSIVLVDCGLFQGPREWREKNWTNPPYDLRKVAAVIITHAHIDHTGLLPRWYANGLNCPIYCSEPTYELAKLLLPDSGRLQEEEAMYRAERGRSRHNPPLPLYTEKDAKRCLEFFKVINLEEKLKIPNTDFYATWKESGHILGACSVNLENAGEKITFSGDIGRYNDPITVDPKPIDVGNALLIESTYGNRSHPDLDPILKLEKVINETFKARGIVLVPSFAVGRTQLLLYYINKLKTEARIPDLPIFVDSPMATDATSIYRKYKSWLGKELLTEWSEGKNPLAPSKLFFTQERSESIKLNSYNQPAIIISASGMLSGGRILHHLKNRLSNEKNTLLFVGFQPPGGRGDLLLNGAKIISIFNEDVVVNARIESISGLSAHGDADDLINWCKQTSGTPEKTMIVHGEEDSARAFKIKVENELKWNAEVARYGQEIEI